MRRVTLTSYLKFICDELHKIFSNSSSTPLNGGCTPLMKKTTSTSEPMMVVALPTLPAVLVFEIGNRLSRSSNSLIWTLSASQMKKIESADKHCYFENYSLKVKTHFSHDCCLLLNFIFVLYYQHRCISQ